MRTLQQDHPALVKGHTIFLKQVKSPTTVARLLQPAATNKKLGGGHTVIKKGKWKGMPMYQLTLEERKTCPKSCEQWGNCYGNNMPFANRISHEDPSFYRNLDSELGLLGKKHPEGFVVRLHVLGDFFSAAYADWWRKALARYPSLRLFGYTHRRWKAIDDLNAAGAWIRFSDRGGPMSANVEGEGIQCPEQVGKTASCLTCGLCWGTDKPIRFSKH